MTGTRLAQPFTNNGLPTTKISAYLKVIGSAAPIQIANDAVIDATNFSELIQGGINESDDVVSQFAVFADDNTTYTGPGYLQIIGSTTLTSDEYGYEGLSEMDFTELTEDEYLALVDATSLTVSSGACQISYVISSSIECSYTFWLRVRSNTISTLTAFVAIDGSPFYFFSLPITTNWTWIGFPVVISDTDAHTITITPSTGPFDIDQIYITNTNTTPSGAMAYTPATYNTIHARIFSTTGTVPNVSQPQYDAKSTIDEIFYDDWYNFDVSSYTNNTASDQSFAVINAVGATTNHSIIWEIAQNNGLAYYKSIAGGTWVAQTDSLALNTYSDFTQTGCIISTPPASIASQGFEDFTIQEYNPVFNNTIDIPYGVDSPYGSNAVELDFENRIVTIILDESGSMSWQDNTGIRHQVTQEIIDRLNTSYPGVLQYNLLTIGTVPVFPVVIPLTTKIVSNDFSEIIRQSFLGNPDNFSGFRVVRQTGRFPNSEIDGEDVGEDGYRISALDENLPTGVEQYYTVYTYDPAYRFSRGVSVKATPRNRIIPSGIASFNGTAVVGSGVVIDANTVGLWHFGEGSGNRIFDFSSSEVSYTITGSYYDWINSSIPVDSFALRFDGINSSVTSDTSNTPYFGPGTPFTFIGWIQPFLAITGKQVIFSRSISGQVSYAIYRNNLNVGITFDGQNFYDWDNVLTVNAWNHIAIAYDGTNPYLYINGIAISSPVTSYVASSILHLTENGSLNIGWDSNDILGNNFFGAVTEFSLHNIERSADYISNAAMLTGGDNSDRMVLLSYTIPDDYDYVGGNFRIVVNKNRPPFHEEDGTIVANGPASPGNYIINICDEFDLTYTYYYRIFSQNTIGNWSDIEDSALAQVIIPDISRSQGPGYSILPAPVLVETISGNEKNYLKWTIATNPNVHRIRIYFDAPTPSGEIIYPYVYEGSIIGNILFDGTPDEFDFVHRGLTNGQLHYYAIVSIDRETRFSGLTLKSFAASPGDYLSDSGIPLLEAENVRYRITDYDRVTVSWDSPVKIGVQTNGYFDQEIYFYAGFLNYMGMPIAIDYPQNFNTNITISGEAIRSIEDGFNLGGDPTIIPQLPQVSWNVSVGGMVTGVLSLANNPILSIVDSISFNLNVNYTIGSQFTYQLPSTAVTLINPLSLTLVNRDKSYAPPACAGSPASNGSPASPPILRDGCYIRRTNPFVIRAIFDYEGQTIPSAQVNVLIYDATDNDVSDDNCSATPNLQILSTTVSLTTYNIPVQVQSVDILDSSGSPMGATQLQSYVDLPISVPQMPYKCVVFVEVSYGGYSIVQKMNVFFINILKMSLTAYAPTPNGYDVREEFCNVWMIDPNDPDNTSSNIVVPDGTLVQWTLSLLNGVVQRPFYSLANIPLSGVWSPTVAGTARNVYFGPAQNIQTVEVYTLTTNVSYSGLSASASDVLTLAPPASIAATAPTNTIYTPRFLMEFPLTENLVWADGVDYAKLTISSNPFTANTRFSSCFISCATNPIIFSNGTSIFLQADGWTMYYGDVFEETDPYTGKTTLMDENATISIGTANVTILGEYTYVYFRRNTLIQNITTLNFTGQCHICPNDAVNPNSPAYTVRGSTKVNYAGKPLQFVGGGDSDGIPPTILIPREPFAFNFIGVRANGQFVNQITIDGITSHEVIVELSWENEAVPDGTPVKLMPVFNGITVSLPKTIYTLAQNDTLINPIGPERSFASVIIPPIQPNVNFGAGILFSATYNVVGNVDRTQQTAITFGFVVNTASSSVTTIGSIVSTLLNRINTSTCDITQLASMQDGRIGHALETVCTDLYAIGGTDGNIIRNTVEAYNIINNTWTYVSPMTIGRAFQQSVRVGQYIYEMGGFTIDLSSGNIVATAKVERYDTLSNTWSVMSPMPFEVANGVAQYIPYSGNIYVLNGYSGQDNTLNESILIYNVTTDTWSQSIQFNNTDLELYQRISPFVFTSNNIIYVAGGLYSIPASIGTDSDGNQYTILAVTKYLTSAYAYDYITDSITDCGNDFRSLLEPRYRGASVYFGNVAYFIGGVNPNSNSLRIMETIDSTSIPFTYTVSSCEAVPGCSSFGATTDYCSGGNNIYISGGINGNTIPGYLQITVTPTPSSVRLQGIQSAAINIYVIDENGNYPNVVKVRVQGFIGSSEVVSSDSISDQILIRTDEINVYNGKGVATLLPRSDDITEFDADKITMLDGTIRSYSITIQATIIDSYYSGSTVTTFDNRSTPTTIATTLTTTGVSNDNLLVSFVNVKTKDYGTTQIYIQPSDGGIVSADQSSVLLGPDNASTLQGNSAVVNYYSDFTWIPQVQHLLVNNNSTYADVTAEISRLAVNIPFGPSPIVDSINQAAGILSQDNSGEKKIIYVFSDGDDNADENTVTNTDLALSFVNNGNIPIISGYYNIVPSQMVLAKGRRITNTTLDQLSQITGGNSYSVVTDNDIPTAVNYAICGGEGAIGYGTFTYTIDLGDVCLIDSVTSNFVVPDGTSAVWQIRTAEDDLVFSDYVDNLAANTTWYFNNQQARYLQFYAILQSTFITNEYGDGSETPLITSISIVYQKSQTSYLYLTIKEPVDNVSQISITFDATRPQLSTFDAGVSTSDRHNWQEYYSDSQLPIDQHGKIIIPVRRQTSTNGTLEPLDAIDSYTFKARYGSWDQSASVIIYDNTNTAIDGSTYGVFPKQGYVVFNTYSNGSYYISIVNQPQLKVGAKITNRIVSEPLTISGAGYMYTTTTPIPVETTQFVQAFNLLLLPFNPTTSSVFQASYAFYDLNGNPEDTSLTQIKWYKVNQSGTTHLSSIDNLATFDNSITSLLSIGDQLYFTVKPSNGVLYGPITQSLTVQISSSSTIYATGLTVLPNPATSNSTFLAFYTFVDTSGNAEMGSIIQWYKNGALVPSLTNVINWTNSGTPSANAVQNDTLYFTVQPSDGKTFGPISTSPVVTLTL